MEQPESHTRLDYQSRTAHQSRGRILRWLLLVIAAVVMLYGFWFAKGILELKMEIRRDAALATAIRAAQETYIVHPTTLRFSEWPQDLRGPYVVSERYREVNSELLLTRQRVTFSFPTDTPLGIMCHPPGPILWTHMMQSPSGRPALVGVKADQFIKGFRQPAFSYLIAYQHEPLVVYAHNTWQPSSAPISGPPGWNSEPVRIYAGQPVPGDKSRFTCKLETPTKIGRLEGQLLDADTGQGFKLTLTVHLDGPNPNPPTSQPAPTTLPTTIPATP